MHLPYLTQLDVIRLERIAQAGLSDEGERERLDEMLARAHIVASEEVPGDVVTMNSQVVYRDLDTQIAHAITLVYPALADSTASRLSVTSPIGAALLGSRQGQLVEAQLPNDRTKALQIMAVTFQPEAAGQLHL